MTILRLKYKVLSYSICTCTLKVSKLELLCQSFPKWITLEVIKEPPNMTITRVDPEVNNELLSGVEQKVNFSIYMGSYAIDKVRIKSINL